MDLFDGTPSTYIGESYDMANGGKAVILECTAQDSLWYLAYMTDNGILYEVQTGAEAESEVAYQTVKAVLDRFTFGSSS